MGKFFCVSFALGLTVSIYLLIVGIYYLQANPYPISISRHRLPPPRYGGLAPCRDGTGHAEHINKRVEVVHVREKIIALLDLIQDEKILEAIYWYVERKLMRNRPND